MQSESKKLLIFVYIITCSIAFVSKIGYTTPSPYIQYGIFVFWILVAIIKFGFNRFKVKSINITIRRFFLIMMLPRAVIHLYSSILFFIGYTEYLTRNTQTYLVVLSVFAIIYIFGRKSFNYTIISMVISFMYVILYNSIAYGITVLPKAIISLITGENPEYSMLFEVNDYSFALGYILIFYIVIKDKFTMRDLLYCFIFLIFMFLGFKRIQILALILIILYAIVGKRIKKKYRLYKIISYLFIIASYLFIFTMSNGIFFDLLNKFGINSAGRNFYFKAAIDLTEFSPTFMGLGRNYLSMMFNSEFSYMNVGGVHSDILKYFVECGFIVFGIWMWFYLIKIMKLIYHRYNFKVVTAYHMLTLYTFLLYYTDNIDIYFISQFIYMSTIVVFAMYDKKLKKCDLEG